jgi:hypothetical protein
MEEHEIWTADSLEAPYSRFTEITSMRQNLEIMDTVHLLTHHIIFSLKSALKEVKGQSAPCGCIFINELAAPDRQLKSFNLLIKLRSCWNDLLHIS